MDELVSAERKEEALRDLSEFFFFLPWSSCHPSQIFYTRVLQGESKTDQRGVERRLRLHT